LEVENEPDVYRVNSEGDGASVAEEIIQEVCHGCAKGNLDFSGPEFCPIQANYGFEGEDEHIMCEVGDLSAETRTWCTEFVKEAGDD
jgi:hypothetical protein